MSTYEKQKHMSLFNIFPLHRDEIFLSFTELWLRTMLFGNPNRTNMTLPSHHALCIVKVYCSCKRLLSYVLTCFPDQSIHPPYVFFFHAQWSTKPALGHYNSSSRFKVFYTLMHCLFRFVLHTAPIYLSSE